MNCPSTLSQCNASLNSARIAVWFYARFRWNNGYPQLWSLLIGPRGPATNRTRVCLPETRWVRRSGPNLGSLNNFDAGPFIRRGLAVDRKRIVAPVLGQGKKYRSFTRMIDDRETAQRILELTEELKVRALALAKPEEDHIRIRAREIWEENGRPSGRDQEFWYQAEREFREAEDLAIHADEDT
jgi:hypothetical protein